MKAVVCRTYGLPDVFKLEEIEKPIPKNNEVLVEIHASSVTTAATVDVSGKPYFVRLMGIGLLKPKTEIPGSEVAGRVEAVGRDVTQFKVGDEVYGNLFSYGNGALAEYVCAREDLFALKPTNLTFAEAAAVPEAALVALQGLRDKGQIRKGQKVMIYGASGGIGTFAVQIAKYFGAEVTGVCSTKNLNLVRSLGADHVIDYTKEDFSQSGPRYDLIFAIAYRSITAQMIALNPQGIYVSTGAPSLTRIFQDMLLGPWIFRNSGKKIMVGWTVKPNQQDLVFIKGLIEAGKVKPVIDRRYPLSEAAQAFRYYAEGHSRGKVVITTKQPIEG